MEINWRWKDRADLQKVASIWRIGGFGYSSDFTDPHAGFADLPLGGSLSSVPGISSSNVIYNMIARKMKSPLYTNAIDNISENRTKVSLGLTLAGIVTATLCVLALLHDTYLTGSGRLTGFIESSSISRVSELVTSASALVSSLGNTVILVVNSFINSF